MYQFDGILKEQEMIYALNNKKISELSNNLRNLLRTLYGVLDDNEIVTCEKVDDAFKTDFVITYKGVKHNVSMKSGKAIVVHNEIFNNFINYLESLGFSNETLETICLFHYGDGTIDGSNAEHRLNYDKVVEKLKDRIKSANEELNKDMDKILMVVTRCVFKGAYEDNLEADCVYFGDTEYGVVASKKQFFRNIQRRGFDYYDHLHIGPLLIRPDARYFNKNIASERKRNRVIVSWPKLREDIEYMAKRFNF